MRQRETCYQGSQTYLNHQYVLGQAHEPHPQSTQAELETEPGEQRQVDDTGDRQRAQEIGSNAESEELELVERGAHSTQEQINIHAGEKTVSS